MSIEGLKIFEFTYSNKGDSRQFYVKVEKYNGIDKYKVSWGSSEETATFYDKFNSKEKLKAIKRANQLIKEFTKNKQLLIKKTKL